MLIDSVPKSKHNIGSMEEKGQYGIENVICLLKLVDPEELPIFVATTRTRAYATASYTGILNHFYYCINND